MNYYNEWDSFAAEWLKQLIKDGLIPDGEVDSRSIADVEPSDLKGFTQCHFFAGIGGWSRALQLAGWSPDRPVWTGSPPCQSFSTAGKGKGKDDERHLWPVFFNLIRECQPPTVFGEQVAAAIRFGWLDDLQIDFEKEGYAAGAFVLPSGGIGAPHKRDRLFFVADSNNKRHERSSRDGRQAQRGSEHSGSISVADSTGCRHKQSEQFSNSRQRPSDKRQSDSSRNCESQHQLVADSNAHGREQGMQQVSREPSKRIGSDGINGRFLGNSDSQGLQMHGEHGELYLREPNGEDQNRLSSDSSISNRNPLVYSNSDRSQQGNETAETTGHWDSINSAGFWSLSVGNSEHDGSHETEVGRGAIEASERGKEGEYFPLQFEGTSRSEISGDICFWQDSTVIYCRDGKYRPIPTEPALFPLADGIPNRVGILRGAGNAIVPQAAAEIIKAYLYD